VSPLQAQDRVEPRDLDGDGKVEQVAHLDQGGNITQLEVDSNGDGKMDTFQYYKNEIVVRLERDTDYDGHIDEITVLKQGKPVRLEKLNPKAKPIAILTFDTHGKPLKWQRDTTGSGHFDTIYEYDQGRLRLIMGDTTGDGQTNVWQRFRDGVPFKQESDLNGGSVKLPQAQAAKQQTQVEIRVYVDEQGRTFLANKQLSLNELFNRLKTLLARSEDRLVVIKADRRVVLNKAGRGQGGGRQEAMSRH